MEDRETSSAAERPRDGMDNEHQVQVKLLDAISHALDSDRDAEVVGDLLDQLVSYSDAHFMSENLLMRLYEYPQYDTHALEHDRLMEEIKELQSRVSGTDPAAFRDALGALKTWLNGHIAGQDEALGKYLGKYGVTG